MTGGSLKLKVLQKMMTPDEVRPHVYGPLTPSAFVHTELKYIPNWGVALLRGNALPSYLLLRIQDCRAILGQLTYLSTLAGWKENLDHFAVN